MKITPVILCGGLGSRLWPLSRQSFPKQFVPLLDKKTLFQLTLERVSFFVSNTGSKNSTHHLICVASEAHRFLVSDSLEAANLVGNETYAGRVKNTVVLEPFGRNTTAAMALAMLSLPVHSSKQDLLLFCPCDHHIPNSQQFVETVQKGVAAAQSGAIVIFGVSPTSPSSAYGYIEQGKARIDGSFQVKQFIEKPDTSKAQDLILNGGMLWNAGIFLMSVKTLFNALKLHSPDILISCEEAMKKSQEDSGFSSQIPNDKGLAPVFIRPDAEAFSACRSESIDYAVMEHFAEVVVIPFIGQWSDVGSWNAVAELTPADAKGNRINGNGITLNSHNTFVLAPHRTVVALGTKDLLIVDTPDALLVASIDYAEQVKEVVRILEKRKIQEAVTHRKVSRPWGWYDTLDVGERFKVKRIGVKPGASLSLQKHQHRAEHWIVVSGTAEVTRGNETFLLSENQSTYIPIGEVHRLKNPGQIYLEMIEVQSGVYLCEDDIVRLNDSYGRTSSA
jgi:mannose-1-phosphate guanylyltransferase/mannose-6-phosphate isomerase